jgi:hypothetical protein
MKRVFFLTLILSSVFLSSCLPILAAAGAGYIGTDKYKKIRKYVTNAKAIYDLIKNNDEIKAVLRDTGCVAVNVDTGNILMDGILSKNLGKLLLSGLSLATKTNKSIEIKGSGQEKNNEVAKKEEKDKNIQTKEGKDVKSEKVADIKSKKVVASNNSSQNLGEKEKPKAEKDTKEVKKEVKVASKKQEEKKEELSNQQQLDNDSKVAKEDNISNKEKENVNLAKKDNQPKDNNSPFKLELCEPGYCKCDRYVLIKIYTARDKITNENITYLSFSIIKNITRLEL